MINEIVALGRGEAHMDGAYDKVFCKIHDREFPASSASAVYRFERRKPSKKSGRDSEKISAMELHNMKKIFVPFAACWLAHANSRRRNQRCSSQVAATSQHSRDDRGRRHIATDLRRRKVSDSAWLQPSMLCTKTGTLIVQAQVPEKSFHVRAWLSVRDRNMGFTR